MTIRKPRSLSCSAKRSNNLRTSTGSPPRSKESPTRSKPPRSKALREPVEAEIRRVAIAICRERCTYIGEPPCFQVARDFRETWPPESCDDPGCIVLATVALVVYLNPDYKP